MEEQDKIKIYEITFFDVETERAKYLINKWIIKSTHTEEDYVVRVNLLNINGKDRVNNIAVWKIALIK